jgi:hypothetical protein
VPAAERACAPVPEAAGAGGAGFALLILVTGVLFTRPAEIISNLAGLPIYEVTIACCLAVSFPAILRQLAPRLLPAQPMTICVLGVLLATGLSFLAGGSLWGLRTAGVEFFKVVLYYLLVIVNITTVDRLRKFTSWLVVFLAVMTVLAVLTYHETIDMPTMEPVREIDVNKLTGEKTVRTRICASGIYNNPNALSRILVVGLAICAYRITDPRSGVLRLVWLAPIGLFGYAIHLSQSRGGLIALMVGMVSLFLGRYGWRKTIALAAVLLPAVFLLFAGRQTNMDTEGGTGQERIRIWSLGLDLFERSPVFGVGKDQYEEHVGICAHNSYVHCYTELGFFGATFFTGAFYVAITTLFRMKRDELKILEPELRRFRPYLLAAVAGYAAGMMSISDSYHLGTYALLGLVAVFHRLVSPYAEFHIPRFDGRLAARLVAVNAIVFVALYLFIRLNVRWS